MSPRRKKTPESEFTARIRDEVVADGGIFIPLVATQMTSGWPDRLVYHRLWHGLLEFKAIKGALDDRQRVNIRDLRRRQPTHVVVVREPNRCEDEEGTLLFTFNNGAELMLKLGLRAAGEIVV